MKLTVEFEEDDLRQMFTKFFDEAGFEVLNLEEIVAIFQEHFPEGIKAIVEPKPMEEVSIKSTPEFRDSITTPTDNRESMISLTNEDNGVSEGPNETPIVAEPMSVTDIMDPTHSGGDISKINKLVAQSQAMESEKADK